MFWIVIVIEGYLIVPMLMGRSMDLNATTVMLACLFWELVWPGMTGSVPGDADHGRHQSDFVQRAGMAALGDTDEFR